MSRVMCTVHTMIASDRDCTTYKRVDVDQADTDVFAFIIVEHRTLNVAHGATEEAARLQLRRLRKPLALEE